MFGKWRNNYGPLDHLLNPTLPEAKRQRQLRVRIFRDISNSPYHPSVAPKNLYLEQHAALTPFRGICNMATPISKLASGNHVADSLGSWELPIGSNAIICAARF